MQPNKETIKSPERKPFVQRRILVWVVLALNALLLCFVIIQFRCYTTAYQERLRKENLQNIANLNRSASLNASALISNWSIRLDDIVQYLDQQQDITVEEALLVIEQSNSSEARQFELIASDYTGYLARREDGAYIPLVYSQSSYTALQKALDNVDDAYDGACFTPEFTDSVTALKYFAVYRHLQLLNDNGEPETYTLLLATKTTDVLSTLNSLDDFEGQSSVLIDSAGNYIVSSSDFKSTNFFQFLYNYNNLTLDQQTAIQQETASNGSGELYYKNAAGQDCVFRYERMAENEWYCITCVPISSFRTPMLSVNYTIYVSIALLFMLLMDVSWLQMLNRRLRASVRREKEANNAKSDFLSRMSHDIRTPLNGIIGLTTLALDEQVSPPAREYLENIKVSGQFLTGLVNDVLDMSKVESGKVELNPEPYYFGDLYKYTDAVIAPLCRDKGLEFRVLPPEATPPILLDRLRFNQIVFNLLSNAVKYTPTGGFVELSWTRTPLPNGYSALDLSVRDNGIGMSEDFQAHMFEPFSQEKEQTAVSGAGLGLAIISSLIQLMDGSIHVESALGVGSTFSIHLEAPECAQLQPDQNAARSTDLRGKRVLLCEDNPINVMVAQRIMEKWGMIVDTAENGKLGVDAFAASAPGTYHAILMDIMMPEMSGFEAARAIRQLDRPDALTVPIMAMTANAYATDVKNCLDAGMNLHMPKPIDPELLRENLALLISDEEASVS